MFGAGLLQAASCMWKTSVFYEMVELRTEIDEKYIGCRVASEADKVCV